MITKNPDNKYCLECSLYKGITFKEARQFHEKMGFEGCVGIAKASEIINYYARPPCFNKDTIRTAKEINNYRVTIVQKVIEKYHNPKQAAEYIVNNVWGSI
jgi:hypothetical protein